MSTIQISLQRKTLIKQRNGTTTST